MSSQLNSIINDLKIYGTRLPLSSVIHIHVPANQSHLNDILLKAIDNILLVTNCTTIVMTIEAITPISLEELNKRNVPVTIYTNIQQNPLLTVLKFITKEMRALNLQLHVLYRFTNDCSYSHDQQTPTSWLTSVSSIAS